MNFRIGVALLASAVVMALSACTSNVESPPVDTNRLAAHAAISTYPSTMPAQTSDHIGAIIDNSANVLEVVNFGNQELDNVDVWVNESFYYHVDGVPPLGYVKLDLSKFYDKNGYALTARQMRVNMVQIKTEHGFFNLMGPVNQ